MLDLFGLVAFGYILLRPKESASGAGTSGRSEPSEPSQPPRPLTPEGDDYRVEEVAIGEQNKIYLLETRRGVLYDDGSGGYSWEKTGYIRGDFPTGFVMAPTSIGGTISFEINEIYYENVLVYSTEAAALTADEIPEDDPSGPQKQPEDDDDTVPSLPPFTRPSFPVFGGESSYGF